MPIIRIDRDKYDSDLLSNQTNCLLMELAVLDSKIAVLKDEFPKLKQLRWHSLSEEDKAAVMAVVGVFVSIERATPEKILPNHTALISLRLTRIEHAWSDSKSGNYRKLRSY